MAVWGISPLSISHLAETLMPIEMFTVVFNGKHTIPFSWSKLYIISTSVIMRSVVFFV
jgi:hypothetical protein